MTAMGNQTICGQVNPEYTIEETSYGNNYDCDAVFVKPPLPDIHIGASRPVINQYLCNGPSAMSFAFQNIGYVSTGPFTVEYQILFNGVEDETFSLEVENLDPLESMGVTSTYVPSQVGAYTINIQCDVPMPLGIVTELSEANNTASYLTNILQCMPDLIVQGCNQFEALPQDLEFPGEATYSAPVVNVGNATAPGPVNFDFVLSSGEIYNLSYPDDIAPGETVDFTTTAASVPPATAQITGIVDPENEIDEFNDVSNQYSDSLCWDFVPVGKCGGYNFWNFTYLPAQSATMNVAIRQHYLYQASNLPIKFEVSGPGIDGTVDLGNANLENVKKTCGCPYQVNHPTPFIFGAPGVYTFTITADPDNMYAECDESNNVLVVNVTVIDPDAPLQICAFSPNSLIPVY